MHIQVVGEDSISAQARTYAEYRLFAALTQIFDAARVRHARLVLRRATHKRAGEAVSCTVTIEIDGAGVLRIRTTGDHSYAAINRAVERLRDVSWPGRLDRRRVERAAAE